ncbi:MAG TPA: NADH-quinone oxidoreductase subunit M [Pirellulales bacterium]|jgi:NADH-quinone oxidoreductase subunit M|nr:NADH-quinone oxidoreductase subunit M [Pirellulales bacterium]
MAPETCYALLLSLIVFLPAIGALAIAFFPREKPLEMKYFAFAVTVATFALTLLMIVPGIGDTWAFKVGLGEMQKTFSLPWIPSFDIVYLMGMDGISFPLVILTTFICMVSMGASWPIEKNVKAYCILYLLLETGILGVFLALDFFLFYVFWEVMLLPMYFLIGVWGGPRREYAAIKFFLYTLFGSVLMLIAILMLYFSSDLRELSDSQLLAAHVVSPRLDEAAQTEALEAIHGASGAQHTFNILALTEMGQHTSLFEDEMLLGKSLEWWAFLLLFIGFIIKVPSVPVHTWLPDAHVEAPTPISMILAGVLLKLGGYGVIRICYPICPHAGFDLAYLVCGLGVLSMVYGAFAALAQKDFKRLVAYSSVSHMGYVLLGIGVWSAVAGNNFDVRYWQMGMNGAMFQMLAHGISSPGMFFMVGVIYDRVHHRNLDQFGGLFARMPVYSGLAVGIFFAGLGLPGLCGFIGEVFVTLSAWKYSMALAIVSAGVVILTAAYILWTLQRVYLGPEYKGPHGDHLHPITGRELAIAVPLLTLAIVFGVFPQLIFNYVTPSVNQEVVALAEWSKNNDTKSTATASVPAVDKAASQSVASEVSKTQ